MSEPYFVTRKDIDRQYRPKGYGLSPGLQRARAPFRTRNAITGVAIGTFVVGVWAYSISAVKQDTFEDLDEEAKALLAARRADEKIKTEMPEATNATSVASASASGISASTNTTGLSSVTPQMTDNSAKESSIVSQVESSPGVRGVLASQLAKRYPNILDPKTGSLVWGAPPVDKIGRLGDKNDRPQ